MAVSAGAVADARERERRLEALRAELVQRELEAFIVPRSLPPLSPTA